MSATVHRQEFPLKDLPTRAVTFYPTQAQIKREIPNVDLKPGANEVEIYGLTPTLDQHSIKVDGVGSASVTDMTVELVQNKESFEQVYPDEVEAEDTDSEDDDEEEDDDEQAPANVLKKEIAALKDDLQREEKNYDLINSRLELMKKWYEHIDLNKLGTSKVVESLEIHQSESATMNDQLIVSRKHGLALQEKIQKKEKELEKATRDTRRAKRRDELEKAKRRKEKSLAKEAVRKEKARVRDERVKFWPRKVYKLTIYLDLPADTPGSSRRSSVSEITISPGMKSGSIDSNGVVSKPTSLMISYITTEASWAPRYDIDLSTGDKSGKISYRAEFINQTCETWTDARVWLSTSQASFRGLDDEVPWMRPWHIGLSKFKGGNDGTTSFQERVSKQNTQAVSNQVNTNRAELFGLEYNAPSGFGHLHVAAKKRRSAPGASNAPAAAGLFGQANSNSVSQAPPPPPSAQQQQQSNVFGAASQFAAMSRHYTNTKSFRTDAMQRDRRSAGDEGKEEEADEDDEDGGLASFGDSSGQRIDFEDTNKEDYGLTTTYELPGSRTLAPSSLTRRYKIATLPFNNLVLTSIAVPKLRSAAFLRARFRNPSTTVTLLKGSAGLNLDGTFLGNTFLVRTSPGQLITLPLGVDPAVQISYAKPTIKRSTQGIFQKESAQTFTRNIIVTNTKPVASDLIILDQIPVSQDEKLRVDIIEPRGFNRVGDKAVTGTNAKEGKEKALKWGKATADYLKNGEIRFDVSLEPKAACKLAIEYETKAPGGEVIVSQ